MRGYRPTNRQADAGERGYLRHSMERIWVVGALAHRPFGTVYPSRRFRSIQNGGLPMMGDHTQPGLDDRHRDKDGKISAKHGNTLISTLRQTYGADSGKGEPGHAKLADVLQRLDEPSLRQLIKNVYG
jgi:hypothetical protein